MPEIREDGNIYFSTPEIADLLHCTSRTVRRWVTQFGFLEDHSPERKERITLKGVDVLNFVRSGFVRLHPDAALRVAQELRVFEVDRTLLFEFALNTASLKRRPS